MDRQRPDQPLEAVAALRRDQDHRLADAPWRNDVSVYTDSAHLAREQQILFRRHPILMGFASEWATPRRLPHRRLCRRADPRSSRGRDGKLRAFLNVCRHRGAKVAQGCGEARVFSCPYHAWTYDLSGKVMGIPDERCFPGVRDERSSLTALPLCEKHGLVWVIPTPAADGVDWFRYRPVARRARARARLVRVRVLVVLRQARDPRDHELEDPRRYLPRGLSHRLPASGVAQGRCCTAT